MPKLCVRYVISNFYQLPQEIGIVALYLHEEAKISII